MISKNAHPGEGARTELRSRGRAARSGRRGYPPSHRRRSPALLAGLAIALIIGAMVLARVFLVGRGGEAERQPAPPSVVQALGAIPADVTSQIGRGTAQGSPIAVNGPPLTGPRGLPEVLYVGAEYCPYCAAERWALVVALSRFGTFQNLQLARSAADDVYPSTPTFSFYGATYQSPYLEFRAVELQSSARVGSTYQTLQTPTPDEEKIVSQYDGPPYVPASQAGAIPFIDVANRYVVTGANVSPEVLDHRSWESIAASLSNPGSDQARAIVGTANLLTAAICQATGETPSTVCSQPAIRQIEASLPRNPPSGASG